MARKLFAGQATYENKQVFYFVFNKLTTPFLHISMDFKFNLKEYITNYHPQKSNSISSSYLEILFMTKRYPAINGFLYKF